MHEGAKKVARTRSYLNGAAVFLGVVYAGALLGCVSESLSVYTCAGFEEGHKDAFGQSDPCHDGVPPAEEACPACIPQGPRGWSQMPVLVWIGPKEQLPERCPPGATTESFRGYTDLYAPGCGCTCAPPTGSCDLPEGLTAYSAICQDPPQGSATSFDAPANWDGTCTPANPIQGGAQCGGVSCVQSLSIDPLVVVEQPCAAIPRLPGSPRYRTAALACIGQADPPCKGEDEGKFCAPKAEGFRHCIYSEGMETQCPDTYPNELIFYDNETPQDDRWCTPCSCGAPSGSVCSALLSVYKNSTCSGANPSDLVVGGLPIASTGQGCLNIMPAGPALGSKEITNVTYEGGVCEPSGGETMGDIDRLGLPNIVCCR